MALNLCRKTCEDLSLEFIPKKGKKVFMIFVEKICGQTSHKNNLGKFEKMRAKILRTPKYLPAPMSHGDVVYRCSVLFPG